MTKLIPLSKQGKNKGKYFAVIDDCDCEQVNRYNWSYSKEYAATMIDGKFAKMHRVLLNAPSNLEVDHIDGNGLNNCRDNLRLCTRSQNMANQRKISATSLFKGIRRHRNKWQAKIRKNGEDLHLGTFGTQESAAHAYDAAALKHFGEFARLNFPQEGTAR